MGTERPAAPPKIRIQQCHDQGHRPTDNSLNHEVALILSALAPQFWKFAYMAAFQMPAAAIPQTTQANKMNGNLAIGVSAKNEHRSNGWSLMGDP